MGGAPGRGRCGGGPGLDQMGRGGVQVLLNRVEAASDQLQTVRRFGAGGPGLAGDAVSGVLDQSADRGQRAGLLVGELGEDAGQLPGRGGRAGLRGGPGGDQAEILLDAAGLVREASQDVCGRGVPGAVEMDQVGDQVQASGLALDGDPPAAAFLAPGSRCPWSARAGERLRPIPVPSVPGRPDEGAHRGGGSPAGRRRGWRRRDAPGEPLRCARPTRRTSRTCARRPG